LFELCDTAIWMDEGHMKLRGSLREAITAYKGRDPFAHLDKETLERLGVSPALSGDA
jgi:ABC-2 type transport system ATP-binding protein